MKTTTAFIISLTCSIVNVWHGSEYALVFDFKYTRVLNMLGVTKHSEYASICLNNFYVCLNMPKYTWICLNLPEWLLFYFIIVMLYLLEYLVTYFNIYTKLQFTIWRNIVYFLEETKFDFSIVAVFDLFFALD